MSNLGIDLFLFGLAGLSVMKRMTTESLTEVASEETAKETAAEPNEPFRASTPPLIIENGEEELINKENFRRVYFCSRHPGCRFYDSRMDWRSVRWHAVRGRWARAARKRSRREDPK